MYNKLRRRDNPRECIRTLAGLPELRGANVARQWGATATSQSPQSCALVPRQDDAPNPLRAYFDAIKEGAGVWKWLHYFELYHRHLHKFIGRPVSVVEVGVYSGGSMPMWRHYFGEDCRVHGVDIQEECKVYEDSHTTIHIGDQADRAFWKRFRKAVLAVDVLIDDGGHQPEQQMVTLEEMLPHLRPGGIYICEDVHGIGNQFTLFAHALADELNAVVWASQQELASTPTPFQAAVHSVHLYPFMVVIEKRDAIVTSFSAPKHGTQWQPFKTR
jgi:Methyltransferase domain